MAAFEGLLTFSPDTGMAVFATTPRPRVVVQVRAEEKTAASRRTARPVPAPAPAVGRKITGTTLAPLLLLPPRTSHTACTREGTKNLWMALWKGELMSPQTAQKMRSTVDGTKLAISRRRRRPPSTSETRTATEAPSRAQSSKTERNRPGHSPGECKDLDADGKPLRGNGEVWKNPADPIIWGPFASATCGELEKLGTAEEDLCKWLCKGVPFPCVAQACCFCGGGSTGDIEQDIRCKNMDFNAMEDVPLNCAFIDSLSADVQRKWCEEKYGDLSLTKDGLTVKEACCACGGGELHSDNAFADGDTARSKRTLRTRQSDTADQDYDAVYLQGEGNAHGIPNLEYLGLGYDMLRGNPRGSLSSELDPGFRYRVLRLRQVQTNQTIDGQFQVPVGTAVKYTSSCRYDDSSVEVSSESDLRSSMSKEATPEMSKRSPTMAGLNLLIFDFSTTVSERESFSKSEKFELQRKANRLSASVSFEARAICSEFEASFIPGYEHKLSAEFRKARDDLPVPYDTNNRRHRNAWDEFFTHFGTHYVRYLVLGGKRIQSTSMSQQAYTSLVSQSVDVASTISFEMGSALGASSQVKAGLVKAAANQASKFGPKGAAIGSIVNVGLEDVNGNEVLFGDNVTAKSDYSLGQFASSEEQAQSAFKISQKKLVNQEYTIGGLPSDDWRAWAETVKEKPMPVRYELGFILDFMSFEQTNSFIAAFQDIYGVKVSAKPEEPFLKGTTHHGVYTGTGEPLSLHTQNPNDDSRVLMQNDVDDAGGTDTSYVKDIELKGRCVDSQKRTYSCVYRWKSGSFGIDSPEDCFVFCEELDQFKHQVGVTIGFDIKGVKPNVTRDYQYCQCGYDAGKLPPTNYYLSYRDGSGPVISGNDYEFEACYPNQNYQRQATFLYSGVWKGKLFSPTALFATPIRGKISPDADEESVYPFSENEADPWNDEVYFALTDNINSNGALAVANFGARKNRITSNSELPHYSFVSIDTLRNYGDNFRSGVVAYNGLMLNEEGKSEFSVRIGRKKFSITFSNAQSYSEAPTVLAFPNWFSINGQNQPITTADVNYAVIDVSTSGFVISHGKVSPVSYLGFNFVVIGSGMHKKTKNIKYGVINECTQSWQEKGGGYPKYGISVKPFQDVQWCKNKEPEQMDDWIKNITDSPGKDAREIPRQHAVEIIFDDPPFDDIPSVIATLFKDEMSPFGEIGDLAATRCVVEHITRSDAKVKCLAIREKDDQSEYTQYSPIPFALLAVGNIDSGYDNPI